MPGNPLGAVVDRSGPVPLAALTAIDSGSFNRVVGLGVEAPAHPGDVDRIIEHYQGLGQSNFRIELAPVATPSGVVRWLEHAGLHPAREAVTKVWRRLEDLDVSSDDGDFSSEDGDVRRLTAADVEGVAALNMRAWGAWQSTVSLRPWFGATVGKDGFAHYGAFVDDRLVCTGALVSDGRLAWIGFDATHPRHRSRQLRRSLTRRRLADARAAGCQIVHAEGRTDRLTGRSRVLDTLYVRRLFVSADDGPQ